MNKVTTAASRLGINRAVLFALATRAWQTLAGVVTILLVALCLSPKEQGFYYAFGSILALQLFFELGLSFVITQFSAHEFGKLAWGPDGRLTGDSAAIGRYLDFLGSAVKWYLFAAIGLLVFVLPIGLTFFSWHAEPKGTDLTWRVPWCVAVLFTSSSLLLVPMLAAIEGGGKVAEIYKLRLIQVACGSTLAWVALISGFGLYAIAANMFASTVAQAFWLLRTHRELASNIVARVGAPRHSTEASFSWKQEVWPVQWRFAISWMAGYFISQLFVPILFHYHGPEVAGQMGMTLTLAAMLTTVSMSWINTSLPVMGRMAAAGRWQELDDLFRRVFWQSVAAFLVGYAAIIGAVWLFSGHVIANRLLPVSETAIFLGSSFTSHIIGALALYLRAHKREPFTILSVVGAMLMVAVIWPLGKGYSSYGMALGALLVNLFYGLPSALWLWRHLRSAWHRP